MVEHLSREIVEQLMKTNFYPSGQWEKFTEIQKKERIGDFIKESQKPYENGTFTYMTMEKRQEMEKQDKKASQPHVKSNSLTPETKNTNFEEVVPPSGVKASQHEWISKAIYRLMKEPYEIPPGLISKKLLKEVEEKAQTFYENLQHAGKSLSDDEIIEYVLKQKYSSISSIESNNVTPETEKIWQPDASLPIERRVNEWASILQNESEPKNLPLSIPPSWKSVLRSLLNAQGVMLKVVGRQGIGKSTFASYLTKELEKASVSVFFTKLEKGNEELGYFEKEREPHIEEKPRIEIEEEMEKTGKSQFRINPTHKWTEITKEWQWDDEVQETKNLILDTWDYMKSSEKDVTKAIDALQHFWVYRASMFKERGKPENVNIVLFLQREALPLHFFLGKMVLVELEPHETEALVKYYKDLFGSCEPFTEEGLKEVAFCSQGIFRKFKQFIAECIKPLFDGGKAPVTIEDVKAKITSERMVNDMNLRLSELFPRSEQNSVWAVKLLRFLREHGRTDQTTLEEEFFNGNKMACSRMLNTLSVYDYITFSREGITGSKKFWELAKRKGEEK